MTSARSQQIDLKSTPYYHCMSRCVRRAYLCGQDKETKRDYSHRKQWLVAQMKRLTKIFAIDISAYAVMSNHYHLVLKVNEIKANAWSENQVQTRWAKIFPIDAKKIDSFGSKKESRDKITLWRERLHSISWFMRCMNETIARLSNLEDDCKGRFWEGRFKSQALLDEGALLTAMVYVDLNPIRAKIANTPETSEFTSIYERIQAIAKHYKQVKEKHRNNPDYQSKIEKSINTAKQPISLVPFITSLGKKNKHTFLDFSLLDYCQLIEDTGKIIREDKPGSISTILAPLLTRLNLKSKTWINMINGIEQQFANAIGNANQLINFNHRFHGSPPKGVRSAREYYAQAA